MSIIEQIVRITTDGDETREEVVGELILCKDCKHGAPNGKYGCTVYHYKRYETHEMKPDDFCSQGERKETEDE